MANKRPHPGRPYAPLLVKRTPFPLIAGNFNFGGGNPMRPHRVRLTHSLVDNYQLTKELLVHRPNMRTAGELQMFHADGEKLRSQSAAWVHCCML